MRYYKCDCCGEAIKKPIGTFEYQGESFDLCQGCALRVFNLVDGDDHK